MPVAVALLAAIGVALLLIMWRGWRTIQVRSASKIGSLAAVPAPEQRGGERTPPIEGTYVSTTTAGDWLDRVAARELGNRAQAVVQVFDAGVLIARSGAADVFVPANALASAARSPGMTGKYVGGEGLVVVQWTTPSRAGEVTALDTGIRTLHKADRAVLADAVNNLVLPTATHPLPADSRTDPKESQ
jgi:hypothetical protein